MHCWHAFNKRLGQQTWAESSTYKLDIMEGKICGLYYTARKRNFIGRSKGSFKEI